MAPEPVDDDVAQARALLERRITTIERRLAELDELRAERERLIKALDLLGPFSSSTPGSGPTSQPTPPRRARPARRSGPREDNAAATLAFLREHPDSQAGAVVAHLGASRGVVYNLLARLVTAGAIEKQPGPGGRATYRLPHPSTAPAETRTSV